MSPSKTDSLSDNIHNIKHNVNIDFVVTNYVVVPSLFSLSNDDS